MADRRDIREAAYSEMESAISGLSTITAADITQESPESVEDLPRIVHRDDYRKVPMNDASAGPHEVNYDQNGSAAEVVYYSMMQGQFGVTVYHDNEQEKEAIYEALRRHFEKYEHGFWDESSIQADVHEVDVLDSTSEDDEDREPVARGDRLLVRLGFKRDFRAVREGLAGTTGYEEYDDTFADSIEEVTHDIDADNDGSTDETYDST